MHVVVMFEPALPGEMLTLAAQCNEVFGPFDDYEKALEWTDRMRQFYGDSRLWLITPLSDPAVVNKIDPATN